MDTQHRAHKIRYIQGRFDLSGMPDDFISFVYSYLFESRPRTRIRLLADEIVRQLKVADRVIATGDGHENVGIRDIETLTGIEE